MNDRFGVDGVVLDQNGVVGGRGSGLVARHIKSKASSSFYHLHFLLLVLYLTFGSFDDGS